MSFLRSLIACQDWLSTDMPLLTELLASAQTREEASPVRGEIFVGAGHFDNSQAPSGATSGLPNNFRAVLTGSPRPSPHSFVAAEGEGEGKRRFDSHWVSLIQGTPP